jgi:protein-S-isoprenylcysteine O-methyltransferase Ste14
MNLELKIPPLLIMVIFGIISWLIAIYTPSSEWLVNIQIAATSFFFVTGSLFLLSSLSLFRKNKTTVNPLEPKATSVIVTTGIYSISRNPMYVGMLLYLLSWGLYLSNYFSILVDIVFIFYINVFQIIPEENILTLQFGQQYKKYQSQVRRWI